MADGRPRLENSFFWRTDGAQCGLERGEALLIKNIASVDCVCLSARNFQLQRGDVGVCDWLRKLNGVHGSRRQ